MNSGGVRSLFLVAKHGTQDEFLQILEVVDDTLQSLPFVKSHMVYNNVMPTSRRSSLLKIVGGMVGVSNKPSRQPESLHPYGGDLLTISSSVELG